MGFPVQLSPHAYVGDDEWLEEASVDFEIIGEITSVQTNATGRGVYSGSALNRAYGRGQWRKMKGVALVRTSFGSLRRAEVHWYEAHGTGKRDCKIKRYVDREP